METLRQFLSKIWQTIPPDWRVAVFGTIIASLVLGVLTVFKNSLLAGFKHLVSRFRQPKVLPPAPPIPLPQQLEIKVTTAPALPPSEPAPSEAATPAPLIPPPPAVGFVTRRDEDKLDLLEILKKALAPTSSQLVALWGDGGHGKTTLAAEAARALKEAFRNRIIWISAERHADFSLSTLLDKIALISGHDELLKLALEPKRAEVQALLSIAPTLVVLDNFETVPATEQELCAEFLAQGFPFPALITTREQLAGARNISLEKMSPEEARELLELLIADADIEQAVAGLNRDDILQAADWNPLVMEWVVAQMMSDQPRQVLNDLAHGEGPAVRRVFDRSFKLPQLGADGRDTLLALSLFIPSATREALAPVAGLGDDIKRLREAVRKLMKLRLVRMTAGNERLYVSGLTRQLAQIRLAEDLRAAEFRQRFVACFLTYARAHAKTTREDFDALEAEKDNALNAMDVAFDMKNWESVIRIRFALEEFLDLRGYWDEAIQRGELAMKAARSSQAENLFADLSHNVAVIYQGRGELDEARRLYNESLKIKKRLGNQSGIASTLHELGRLAQSQGEIEEARRLYNESLEIAKRLGNQRFIASTLHQLGWLAQNQGEMEEARQLYNESLEIERKLGNQSGIAISLHQLAMLAQDQGEMEEARRLYNESLEIKKRLGDQGGIASTFGQLGLLAAEEGDKVEAVRLMREALGIFERLKSPNAEKARQNLARLEGEAS